MNHLDESTMFHTTLHSELCTTAHHSDQEVICKRKKCTLADTPCISVNSYCTTYQCNFRDCPLQLLYCLHVAIPLYGVVLLGCCPHISTRSSGWCVQSSCSSSRCHAQLPSQECWWTERWCQRHDIVLLVVYLLSHLTKCLVFLTWEPACPIKWRPGAWVVMWLDSP